MTTPSIIVNKVELIRIFNFMSQYTFNQQNHYSAESSSVIVNSVSGKGSTSTLTPPPRPYIKAEVKVTTHSFSWSRTQFTSGSSMDKITVCVYCRRDYVHRAVIAQLVRAKGRGFEAPWVAMIPWWRLVHSSTNTRTWQDVMVMR